jgi:hypothetical protein
MPPNGLGDAFTILGRRLTLTSVWIDPGESGAQFLLGTSLLLFPQQPQRIANHFAGIAVLTGPHLIGHELFPSGGQ